MCKLPCTWSNYTAGDDFRCEFPTVKAHLQLYLEGSLVVHILGAHRELLCVRATHQGEGCCPEAALYIERLDSSAGQL